MTGSIVHENTIIALGSIATVWMVFKRGEKSSHTHAVCLKGYKSIHISEKCSLCPCVSLLTILAKAVSD